MLAGAFVRRRTLGGSLAVAPRALDVFGTRRHRAARQPRVLAHLGRVVAEHRRRMRVEVRDEVAKQLSEPTFQVVVQKALALNDMMKERGLTSPYQLLLEPPTDYAKLRRHRNDRY